MSGILACMGGGVSPPFVLDITNTVNPNIPGLLAAASGWLGPGLQAVRIVNTGLVNYLDIKASLSNVDMTLYNGPGARIGGTANGGTAMYVRAPIKVDNQGIISGGAAGV